MTTNINGHQIIVPQNVAAHIDGNGPGAFDWLTYKGYEIYTLETQGEEPAIYTGPFVAGLEGEGEMDLEAETLPEIMTMIDALVA